MSQYSIFWIKEEFADYYFYKSGILYRFLKSYQRNSTRPELISQYHYVTKSFPKNKLISNIYEGSPHNTEIIRKGFQFELHKDNKMVFLQIHKNHLTFQCDTMCDAEEILFPALRLFHPYLFVIGTTIEDFGWITPAVKNNVNNRQVLYSFL